MLPVVFALVRLLLPAGRQETLSLAGDWAESDAVFFAVSPPARPSFGDEAATRTCRSALLPWLDACADAAARKVLSSPPPARPRPRSAWVAVLLYLPTVFSLLAPGRTVADAEEASPAGLSVAREELERARSELALPPPLRPRAPGPPGGRNPVSRPDADEIEAARSLAAEAGRSAEALRNAARSIPALADAAKAIENADPAALKAALDRLAQAAAAGELAPARRTATAEALAASAELAVRDDIRRAFEAAASALASGDAAGTGPALRALAELLEADLRVARRIESALITLERHATGASDAAVTRSAARPAADAAVDSWRRPTIEAGSTAGLLVEGGRDARSTAVLRRYFQEPR